MNTEDISKLQHHLIPVGRLELDDVLPYIPLGIRDYNIDGRIYRVEVGSKKLRVYRRNLVCPGCGAQGDYFVLFYDPNSRILGNIQPAVIQLYTKDGILMNLDHICPKSKNGSNNEDNLRTMCVICNQKKGSKYDCSIS